MSYGQECNHETLQFSSGDYYITCLTCFRNWVITGLNGDMPDAKNCTPGFDDTRIRKVVKEEGR